ncbi:MAG: flagellar hook-basal body complex protein [Clostridiaceae bacterium]|nr:flagellar hook-basal body complex protein [Eubacteriales bacterium]
MLRSIYLSATNMIVQRAKVDVISNNIANTDTTGYKNDKLVSRSFSDMLLSRLDDPAVLRTAERVGSLNTGVHVDELITDFSQGAMEETGEKANLAINGENAFFVVSTPAGDRYTRDGSFHINAEGYLVTSSGNLVQGENGSSVQINAAGFSVDGQGNVLVNGKNVAKLKLVGFSDTAALRKAGDNLFYNYGGATVASATGYSVRQGYLEVSNTDIAAQVIDMMSASRSYETSQRVVKMLDESLGKAVNEVGRV